MFKVSDLNQIRHPIRKLIQFGIFISSKLFDFFSPILLVILPKNNPIIAQIYFRRGSKLFVVLKEALGDLESTKSEILDIATLAVRCYDLALAKNPYLLAAHRYKTSIALIVGNSNDFVKGLSNYYEAKNELAKKYQQNQLGIRLIQPYEIMKNFGSMSMFEAFFKVHALENKTEQYILAFDKIRWDEFVNPHLMSYWRKYIKIIDDPKTSKTLSKLLQFSYDETFGPVKVGDKILHTHSALALIQNRWDDEGRPPLFELTQTDCSRGLEALKKFGVKIGDWFVCIHIRGEGARGDEPFRQAPIEDYFKTVETITKRGGWVIRMGDSSMTPWPKMDRVYDYANSSLREDWLDIFLCGACKFFIGTSSGVYAIAHAFGRPIVNTNYLPTSTIYLSKKNLFIPKLARWTSTKEILSFEELMSPPFSIAANDGLISKIIGAEVINNSSEEILEVVEEMMNRIDNNLVYDEEENFLQNRFRQLTADVETLIGLKGVPLNCRIGSKFLQRHKNLLPYNLEPKIKKYRRQDAPS